jgi:hypothetical protein
MEIIISNVLEKNIKSNPTYRDGVCDGHSCGGSRNGCLSLSDTYA